MKILILGGAGFLGTNLTHRCLKDVDNKVTVLDLLDPRLKSTREHLDALGDKITFIEGDIRDFELMKKVVQGQDVIFNCAGQTSHPLSLKDPLFDADVNCKGNLVVLEAIRECNPDAKVIYASSSTVIGKAIYDVVDETHPEAPLEIYSANKGVAEKYYEIYHQVHGLHTLSLRFANLYGPYGKGYPEFGFINYFISVAQADEEITIYGDGAQTRNVMYVEDACDLMYRCIECAEMHGGVYFAVHREHYSIKQIAQTIVDVLKTGKLTQVPWPEMRKKIEIDDVIISDKKLFEHIKFRPQYTLESGLQKMAEMRVVNS